MENLDKLLYYGKSISYVMFPTCSKLLPTVIQYSPLEAWESSARIAAQDVYGFITLAQGSTTNI